MKYERCKFNFHCSLRIPEQSFHRFRSYFSTDSAGKVSTCRVLDRVFLYQRGELRHRLASVGTDGLHDKWTYHRAECTVYTLNDTKRIFDIRLAGELARALRPHGFVRVHRDYLVNLRRVREIRRRSKGRDWELKLSSPVNRVLPVSRRALKEIWSAFER